MVVRLPQTTPTYAKIVRVGRKQAEAGGVFISQLREWALKTPSAPFFSDGTQSVTYEAAHTFVVRVALRFRELGVQPGDIVALDMPMGLQVIFACAAMHEAAASLTYTPATLPATEAGFDWLFSTNPNNSSLASNTVAVSGSFLDSLPGYDDAVTPRPFAGSDALCRIAFSSGTTGVPKQVPLTVDMVLDRSDAAFELFEPGRPFMSLLDLGSASGFHTFVAGLLTGRCYLNPGDARHNVDVIRSQGVSVIKASPTQIALLLAECKQQGLILPSLARVYSAGGVVPVSLRKSVREHTSARLFNLYGSTEVGRAAERELTDDDLTYAGDVVAGTELEVVDEEDRRIPVGEMGRVRYRREHMSTGYRNDPQATAEAFRDGWFYTGDLGSLDHEGRLTLLGRSSHVINVGGVKVSPAEIEGYVNELAEVTESACFVYESDSGVAEFVVAIIAAETLDVLECSRDLRDRFGPLAPTGIFRLPELPRTGAGKVRLSELSRLYGEAVSGRSPTSERR